MSNKTLETFFQILAAVLLGIALFFLWRGNYESVFIVSVLCSVSYFVSFRFQVKERLDRREAERADREIAETELSRNILRENSELFEIGNETFDNLPDKTPSEK